MHPRVDQDIAIIQSKVVVFYNFADFVSSDFSNIIKLLTIIQFFIFLLLQTAGQLRNKILRYTLGRGRTLYLGEACHSNMFKT